MIRFLFDPLGDWHHDLVLKIDGLPSMAQVVDSHYLSGFLGEKDEEEVGDVRRNVVLRYIEYVQEQITSMNGQARFIAVDLSDQYVGGLLVRVGMKGLVSVKYVWSNKLAGYEVSFKSDFASVSWKEEREWQLSMDAVLEGLNWSKRTIGGSHE
jgi:hypothetical protein